MSSYSAWNAKAFILSFVLAIPTTVFANDILSTEGFQSCQNNASVTVNQMNIQFDRSTNLVVFDVSGTSTSEQFVNASLTVSAYGHEIYSKQFDPCDETTKVQQLCPVPAGTFSASGSQKVPAKYADMIPAIAYQVPDLGGAGKLQLYTAPNQPVACVESTVGNGRTLNIPSVKYAAAGIAAGALLFSGLSAATGGVKGGSTSSPTFTETMHWFQGIAMNGMLSVNYPGVYRSFTQNFGFSTGLIPWDSVQVTIDNFRASTGGNLTHDNIQYLRNSTLVYTDSTNITKRSVPFMLNRAMLFARGVTTGVNGTTVTGNGTDIQASNATNAGPTNINTVKGIAAYAETLMVPESNTFMNVLLIFAIVLAAITCGILLFKVILEAWALFASFPKKLEGFRKRYWWTLAKTITNLILVLYGTWTLYCVYMFKDGKSGWAAKLLAGITLGLFTAILLGFTIRIWLMARKAKKIEGDSSATLHEDKEVWVRYSIFYDSYKKSYWWLFVPIIVYMFAKGCIIAGGEGHGMFQCAGQLVIDSLLLLLLLFLRPYSLKSGNWINIIIQVVRVLSVVCILIFVEELGFSQTTKTITGVVLIVVQGVLTAVLAILIAVNALINCCKLNPHRKARKDAEKLGKDDLTPLDAHNSWLMHPVDQKKPGFDVTSIHSRGRSHNGYDVVSTREESNAPLARFGAGMGQAGHDRSRSHSPDEYMQYHQRQPVLPNLEYQGRGIGHAM